jgi:Protein of unknown function (DUF4232)
MGTAMTRYGQIGWRVIAVLAFTGTAVLAVTLSRQPASERSALSSDSSVGMCAVSGLEARLGRDGAGGTVLEFTNISGRPCGLFGYPDVSAYAGGRGTGTQIGTAAVHDASVRPRPVVLAPGATARAVLRVAGAGTLQRAGCGRVVAPELRVVLPDSDRPAFVRARVPACAKGRPAFMSVRPIEAPGHAES